MAWHGMAWGECKPRFRKFYRKTSNQLGVNWHSIPWGPGLYLSSLKWVLGVGGCGRGWWNRTHLGPRLCSPCPLLDAGFWRSKFDPSLTQRETFHLDEQCTVPVDMMQARTYPLRWFLLEQPEIQVTLDCSDWAWVLGGGKGSSRQAVEQGQGWGDVPLPSL